MLPQIKPSLNWLLIFIPITLALEHIAVAPPVLFFSAALAVVPVAGLIVKATEQIALRTNDAVGGLLNATFGNAPELIIGMVALRAGLLGMVRASLIGAILANLLLALGLSFFLGGMRHHVQRFNPTAARTYSTMMLLASMSLGYLQFASVARAEFVAPFPNRLIRHRDAALGEEIFNVAEAQAEPMVGPDRVADNFARKNGTRSNAVGRSSFSQFFSFRAQIDSSVW